MYVFTAELELQGKETEEGSEEQVWSSLLRPVVARVVSFGLWCGGDSMLLRNTPDMLPRFFPNPLPPAGNKRRKKYTPQQQQQDVENEKKNQLRKRSTFRQYNGKLHLTSSNPVSGGASSCKQSITSNPGKSIFQVFICLPITTLYLATYSEYFFF